MKTILVYKAPDVLSYQRIVSDLYQQGILCYGQDTSVTIIYPNTPNLYLAGASAIQTGYPIYVSEDSAEKAKALIQELENQAVGLEESKDKSILPSKEDLEIELAEIHARRFFVASLLSLMLPIIPLMLGFYFFKEAKGYGYQFKGLRFWVSLILFSANLIVTVELVSLIKAG